MASQITIAKLRELADSDLLTGWIERIEMERRVATQSALRAAADEIERLRIGTIFFDAIDPGLQQILNDLVTKPDRWIRMTEVDGQLVAIAIPPEEYLKPSGEG